MNVLQPWRTPSLPPANRAAWSPLRIPRPPASTPVIRTPGSSRNSKNSPIALLPPPTHAISSSGSLPSRARICSLASIADHPVEVAHHLRVGARPVGRAQDVVGRADIGHPVAHRLVDGLLERPLARLDAPHLGAHQAHPEDVERLALHVDGPHVDDALEAELRAHRGRGYAVLARAGFRDDPLLAHAPGEQRLADRVVDLVGAGVEQVLALEVDLRPAAVARQALREVERRGPPGELGEVPPELRLELGVHAGRRVDGMELLKGGHQGLRHEDAAVRPEVAGRVRQRESVDGGCSFG